MLCTYYLATITIYMVIERRADLVEAEAVESDVAPCHKSAKDTFFFFCDKSFNLSVSVLQL